MVETAERVVQQIGRWADELIDLSKRNRSLYYRGTKPGARRPTRSSLQLVRPSAEELISKVTFADPLGFFLPPAVTEGETWTVERSVASASRGELVSDRITRADVEATLRSLERNAQSDLIDRGIHTLYLSFGLLRWRLVEEDDWVRSPLVFVPVTLERGSPRDPYMLRRGEGDGFLNASLRVLLGQHFEVELPEIDPDPLEIPPGSLE